MGDSKHVLRLISWNTAHRSKCIQEQICAVTELNCGVIALQEVTALTTQQWHDALRQRGFDQTVDSFQFAKDGTKLIGPRRYGELIACRWPLRVLPQNGFKVPWLERILSVVIESPWGDIRLYNTHIPPGATNGWIKIKMLNGLYRRLARHTKVHRILCGDFNTPKEETCTGKSIAWGKPESRWYEAEHRVVQDLAPFGLIDVFRYQYGYQTEAFSWYAPHGIGRRYDHLFASWSLLSGGVNCTYLHEFRDARLSDHSPIRCDFEMGS